MTNFASKFCAVLSPSEPQVSKQPILCNSQVYSETKAADHDQEDDEYIKKLASLLVDIPNCFRVDFKHEMRPGTHFNSYLVLMKSEKDHWAQRGVCWKGHFQLLHNFMWQVIHPLSSLQSLLRFLKTFCYIQKVPLYTVIVLTTFTLWKPYVFIREVSLRTNDCWCSFTIDPNRRLDRRGSRIPGAFGGWYGHLGLGLGL